MENMVIAAPALNFQPKQATLPVKSFLQRLLLITEGRITDIVQAYSGETVEEVKLSQKQIVSDSRFSPLQLDREYQLLSRSTVLQGSQTKINYLYIDSQIVLERLDADIRDALIFGHQPISKLLEENKVKTYREVLDCGIESAGSLGQYFSLAPSTELIYRTYLLLINGLPVMQISEKFPTDYFIEHETFSI
ncbi:MAG: chorismate pyruvate-lyase family protein [Cyanobacteria bacterium P01_C01_bin.72]